MIPKKTWICFTILFLCVLLLLSGCAKKAELPAESTAVPPPQETLEPTPEPTPEPTLEPTLAPTPTPQAEPEETEVSFGLEETLTLEGFCEISGLYAEVLDDKAIKEGWYYYYTDSDSSPAEIKKWELVEGAYTTAEALFTVKNLSDQPQIYGSRLTAKMTYLEDENAQPVVFEGTVFQQNPGQVDGNGQIVMWSTKPVEIASGESTNVSFRFDIPKEVYEKMLAAAKGEENGISETCTFDFGTGTTYVIDLKKSLIPASEYEE